MAKEYELKPCPFCGGEADEDGLFGEGWIGCRKCCVFMDYIGGERGKILAIEAWNRRAKDVNANA